MVYLVLKEYQSQSIKGIFIIKAQKSKEQVKTESIFYFKN